MTRSQTFTAFQGHEMLAHGQLVDVAAAVLLAGGAAIVLDDGAGETVELDLRKGPEAAAVEYHARTAKPETATARPGRGRPKLGVVAREVTLLPRHWEWLAAQPGGASAALRRLVEEARRANAGPERLRRLQETLYRVMSVLAGDLPGFEDSARALFAGDFARMDAIVDGWPGDVADYVRRLVRDLQD